MASSSAWEITRREKRQLFVAAGTLVSVIANFACVITVYLSVIVTGPAHAPLLVAALLLAILAAVLQVVVMVVGHQEIVSRAAVLVGATKAKAQTDELFAMTDMLQSAEGYDDATAVLQASALRLLPEYGAALYIFNNSRDRLDLSGSWNMPEGMTLGETLAPSNCWALKRGKPHINSPQDNTLCCNHHSSTISTVEIPMMACGVVHGLLVLAYDGEDALERVKAERRLGRALADSMSLALANIALREKLRTQSMRDPLTGLYNRRYMEDALERYLSLGERTGASTAVLMVDLDNFKLLNDEYGHAKGDAVMRDVATQMVGGLRPSDVICRYGGEEFLVILPNCSIEDAAAKAEHLRERIETLSEAHQANISASFGVAAVPQTSTSSTDLVPLADAALYKAKTTGKNRVVCADPRTMRDGAAPRLAATA